MKRRKFSAHFLRLHLRIVVVLVSLSQDPRVAPNKPPSVKSLRRKSIWSSEGP